MAHVPGFARLQFPARLPGRWQLPLTPGATMASVPTPALDAAAVAFLGAASSDHLQRLQLSDHHALVQVAEAHKGGRGRCRL